MFEESAVTVFSGNIHDPFGQKGNQERIDGHAKDSRFDAKYVASVPVHTMPMAMPMAMPMHPGVYPAYQHRMHPFGLGVGDYDYSRREMQGDDLGAQSQDGDRDESTTFLGDGDASSIGASQMYSQVGSEASFDFDYRSQAGDDMSEIMSQSG